VFREKRPARTAGGSAVNMRHAHQRHPGAGRDLRQPPHGQTNQLHPRRPVIPDLRANESTRRDPAQAPSKTPLHCYAARRFETSHVEHIQRAWMPAFAGMTTNEHGAEPLPDSAEHCGRGPATCHADPTGCCACGSGSVAARDTPTNVIPAQAGIHASLPHESRPSAPLTLCHPGQASACERRAGIQRKTRRRRHSAAELRTPPTALRTPTQCLGVREHKRSCSKRRARASSAAP